MNSLDSRRRFLGRVAAVVGGLVAVPVLGARPALAGHSRRRFYGGWGYGGYGMPFRGGSHRRFYGGYGYPGYGGYGGGFGGYPGYAAPRFYGAPYGGFGGPGYYGGGYGGYGAYGYPRILKREASPFRDPLGLLEA